MMPKIALRYDREQRLVVKPLLQWLKRQKARWKLVKPKYGTSATGWDIEARRKNQDLLIEAKFITGPFLASFASLAAAPLARRPQRFVASKYRSWSYNVCWAIGASYREANLYQILLDYLSRNLTFWKHYQKDLRLKYVFFVRNGRVARVRFVSILKIAVWYKKAAEQAGLHERRQIANKLMGGLLRFG
jgi:hypothetical protein